ncbi:hypothetical protein TNCT_541371 [Trichonephila clavata]|uniref:Uncharacterized protein n=1 Tax=Trichonephila clavata TaxID=2740835 RepID=A0A8X6F468_TRICU|nr:hypothetical protein TNCT_541371 [Trichonephila clavata]
MIDYFYLTHNKQGNLSKSIKYEKGKERNLFFPKDFGKTTFMIMHEGTIISSRKFSKRKVGKENLEFKAKVAEKKMERWNKRDVERKEIFLVEEKERIVKDNTREEKAFFPLQR